MHADNLTDLSLASVPAVAQEMMVMTTMMTGRQLLRIKEEKKKVRKPKYERGKSKKKYSTLQRGKKSNECVFNLI